jgi:hypothetical protein
LFANRCRPNTLSKEEQETHQISFKKHPETLKIRRKKRKKKKKKKEKKEKKKKRKKKKEK